MTDELTQEQLVVGFRHILKENQKSNPQMLLVIGPAWAKFAQDNGIELGPHVVVENPHSGEKTPLVK